MVGSSDSIACPNMILNTIVADVLCRFADELEKADDFKAALSALIQKTIREHKRIIFNGNNYAPEWVDEAKKRGLLNLCSTVDALPLYVADDNVKLFARHGVLSGTEIHSRCEIQLENYYKQINIEALTMADMVRKDILPAAASYMKDLAAEAARKKELGLDKGFEIPLLKKLSALADELYADTEKLEEADHNAPQSGDSLAAAKYYRGTVFPLMEEIRKPADEIESLVGSRYWPYPTYGELLFSVV